ncbi:hypothetical protein [Silvimonas amylolytica]|uniref:Uncharacterized protein n=1 Tax=Silvimonas amylolytica TaxID=449663 RepID=A0ABQ2PRD0_9NEIS|nr:hypothetical protein [Silvimonas amylolytica]GGP27795.1 hypothetical protein GCM10010971_36140 [Silvimonas amylolytica]
MSPETLFRLHLVLGYLVWLVCFFTYVWPRLRSMAPFEAHRAIATLHSFRFFGLAFMLPGVVSADLPASFAVATAYGDLMTGLLATLALLMARKRPLFWLLAVAFNLVGLVDILFAYYHAMVAGIPQHAGQLGAMYVVPVLYVPLLVITHVTAFYLLMRTRRAPRTAGQQNHVQYT